MADVNIEFGRPDLMDGYEDTIIEDDEADGASVSECSGSTQTTTSTATRRANRTGILPGKYVLHVAHRVKNKFGTPKYTGATRRVVQEYASKLMATDGHRPSHINRDLPHVLNLVFTPSKDELWWAHKFNGAAQDANKELHSLMPSNN